MNGADALLHTLTNNGVDVCFTNPGTSEMHFVAALDQQDNMRSILGLFEGAVTGAADGYGRMAGKPACTLLHLGPGLANGLANLHNARRAYTPIINIVGEHATYHRELDAPLTSDIHGFASPVSSWIGTIARAEDTGAQAVAAIEASRAFPGSIATLIAPADTAWSETTALGGSADVRGPAPFDAAAVDAAARALRDGKRAALLLNGTATGEAGLADAARIRSATGALVLGDTFLARAARGAGRPDVPKLPYFAEQALEALDGIDVLLVAGTKAPVSFFAYPGVPSELTPSGAEPIVLADPTQDAAGALAALAEALGVGGSAPEVSAFDPPARPRGQHLDPDLIAASVGNLLPEQAIIVNEAATSGFAIPDLTARAAPHDWLDLTGGAIGMGIPAATGAAVACPDRKVVNLQADGSALYTIQALWTQAREGLDVTTVLFNNRKYAILQVEFMRVGANPGPKAMDMLDLSRPDIDFVALAGSLGVPGSRATTADEFHRALGEGLATPGPYLVEAII